MTVTRSSQRNGHPEVIMGTDAPQNTFLLNIQSIYPSLTKAEKKVADYVLQDHKSVRFMSINDLADACNVSLTSVFRFCKALHLKGYQDFRVQLTLSSNSASDSDTAREEAEMLPGQVTRADSFGAMVQKVLQSHMSPLKETAALVDMEAVEKASKMVLDSDQVRFFGVGGSMLTAMEGMYKFLHIMPNVYCLSDSHMQTMAASTLNEHDTAIFISYSGSSKELVEMAKSAHENHCKTIGITQYSNSPMTQYMDVILLCGGYESPLQEGAFPSKTAHMFMLDLLFTEVYRSRFLYSKRINEQVTESITNKVY